MKASASVTLSESKLVKIMKSAGGGKLDRSDVTFLCILE